MRMWRIVLKGRTVGYDSNYEDAVRIARLIGATVEPEEHKR